MPHGLVAETMRLPVHRKERFRATSASNRQNIVGS